mmetsp:Transcript_3600/g.6560  ORF Transcript_3600/g.6560 Transcript_3600/m.6560 type:complete len:102 (-) Transcript_3600:704-1009(-)
MPSSWARLVISNCRVSRSCLSSAPSGSSISTSSGSNTSARLRAIRCCWPPESWAGRRLMKSPICTMSSARLILPSRSDLDMPRTSSGNERFSPTVICGNKA